MGNACLQRRTVVTSVIAPLSQRSLARPVRSRCATGGSFIDGDAVSLTDFKTSRRACDEDQVTNSSDQLLLCSELAHNMNYFGCWEAANGLSRFAALKPVPKSRKRHTTFFWGN
jgi:hypothetical protein